MSVSADNDSDTNLILKGAIYDISPLNIILAIHVIIHNTIIIVDYYKDRAKLTSTLFMGIAISDILTAQGLLIISVISILVYRGHVDENVLYNSFYYYMITGLPGLSSSRFLNLVMSVTLTVHIVDPYRRLNTAVLKRSCVAVISVLTCLHISDALSAATGEYKYHVTEGFKYEYVREVAFSEFPGFTTTVMFILCNLEKDKMDIRSCVDKLEYRYSLLYPVVAIFEMLYQLVLVFTIPICMIVQVVYLRRGSVLVSHEKRRASNTIMINSLLYFICQVTYFIMVFFWSEWLYKVSIKPEIVGLFLGLTEFTLPLLYAAVFPIVLICRKEELRRRYQDRLSRIIFCCRESQVSDEVRNDVPEEVNHDVADEAAGNAN